MTDRKERKREYQEREKRAGIFQIKNRMSGKVLLGSSLNLDGPLNLHRFALRMGNHRNRELQRDWNELGPEAFVFEILDVVQPGDDPGFNMADELTLLEQLWIAELQPFGERGYNQNDRIRQA